MPRPAKSSSGWIRPATCTCPSAQCRSAWLTGRFNRTGTIYVTDFTGLRVKNMTERRRRLRAAGGEYVVVKNTLALRALQAASKGGLDDVLQGPTGDRKSVV